VGQLLTTDQRDFEGSGALAWAGASVTLSRDAVAPIVGTKSLKAVSTAGGLVFWWPTAEQITITPGVRTYHVTAQFKGPAGRAMQLWVRRWNTDLVTYTDSVHSFTSTGATQPIAGKVTTAADTPAVSFYLLDFASVLGDSYWLDSVSFSDELVLASYTVELGLVAKPLDPLSSVVWTDVSEWMLGWSSSQGRSRERDPIQAGTAAVELDNADGQFDAMNSTSPYWPNLKPMRRLRITETYQGVTYRRFTGYVDEFRLNRPNAHYSTVTVKATDGFKLLNLLTLIDPYEHAVLSANPRAFYRFRENAALQRLALTDSSGNGHAAELYNPRQTVNETFEEGYEFVDPDWAPGGRLVSFLDDAFGGAFGGLEAEAAGYGVAFDAAVLGTADFSISFLYRRDPANEVSNGSLLGQTEQFAFTDPGDNLVIQELVFDGGPHGLRLAVWRSGVALLDLSMVLGYFDAAGNFVPTNPGSQGLDQVIITRTGTTFTIHYKSGAPAASDAVEVTVSGVASANPSFISPKFWMGTVSGHSYINGVYYSYAGLLGEVATYPTVLTSPERTAIYDSFHRWRHHTAGERIGEVLDQVGVASADRSLEAGVSTLGLFEGGISALAHLQEVAQADDGIFFFAGDGKATFYSRRHLMEATRSTAVQVVFGDSGDGTVVPYEPTGLDPVMEENDIYNEAIVQRDGGSPQRAVDDSSIEDYGRRTLTESGLKFEDDNQALARAQFKAVQYAEPLARVRSLTFSELDTLPIPTAFPPHLGLQLWDRVTYRQQLTNSALWEQDSIVEGLSHSYDGYTGTRKVSVTLSSLPAALSEGGYWVLNVSQLGVGKLAY
jgi:hypothetical protein